MFVLAHSSRGFSLVSTGSIVLGLWSDRMHVRANHSPHDQEAKRKQAGHDLRTHH